MHNIPEVIFLKKFITAALAFCMILSNTAVAESWGN
jgi:hypothetical protein